MGEQCESITDSPMYGRYDEHELIKKYGKRSVDKMVNKFAHLHKRIPWTPWDGTVEDALWVARIEKEVVLPIILALILLCLWIAAPWCSLPHVSCLSPFAKIHITRNHQ